MFWNLDKKIDILISQMHTHYEDNDKRLDNIEKVLIAQEINLETHMKRSDNTEQMLIEQRAYIEDIREKELKPLHKHVNMIEGAFKFLGILGIVISIVGGGAKILGFI